MKNHLNITCLGLLVHFICLSASAQWLQATTIPFSNTQQVAFPALNAAYLSDSDGNLYKSVDGGANWTLHYSFGPFSNLNDPQFMNADTGFVSVNGGVSMTVDGGATWTAIAKSWGQQQGLPPLKRVKFADERVFGSFASGDTSFVLSSDDLGLTYDTILLNVIPNAQEYLFDFVDSLNGYFIDNLRSDLVISTTNACQTLDTVFTTSGAIPLEMNYEIRTPIRGFLFGDWGTQSEPRYYTIGNAYYNYLDLDGFGVLPVLDMELDVNLVYATTLYGKIYVSNNHGSSWIEQTTPVSAPVTSIDFADDTHGIAVTNNTILYTSNGGFVGIDELERVYASVFPNPATDRLTIVPVENAIINSIRLIDSNGKDIEPRLINATMQIDVSELRSGIYFVDVETNKGNSRVRFIKQ